jgi:hypothetical protein
VIHILVDFPTFKISIDFFIFFLKNGEIGDAKFSLFCITYFTIFKKKNEEIKTKLFELTISDLQLQIYLSIRAQFADPPKRRCAC